NNSHDGYDCQQQFSFVYKQELSYNQNYDETSDKVSQANHFVQNEESSNEIAILNSNQEKEEPPQDSDICQLIREECSTEVSEKQKQSMEDTMLELVKIYQEKEFLCIHDDIDDLIESALNSKLLLINSNSQQIPKSDFDFEEEIRFIENLLYDNSSPRPPEEFNAEIADTIIESIPLLPILVQDGNSQWEEIDIVTKTDDVLPPSVENDDDSSNDHLLEEAGLFLFDNSIPPCIENVADDPEGDIRFLKELLIDDFILSHESFDSNFEDNPSIPRPPPEPPDAETDAGEEILVVMNRKNKDYSSFIFVIFDKVFSLLSAESKDTIFDLGISD
nr:hypothetical protein [Tanacetum cinerariifolium]GFA05293.1 hypothetical protein [Tanacetum cinerariifolium]